MSSARAPRLKWGDLAEAMAGAGFSLADDAAGELPPEEPAAAAARAVVDNAVAVVEERRRTGTRPTGPGDPAAVPLDLDVFDAQTLGDLLEFLRHARRGMLTAAEMAEEAGLWKVLVEAGWPAEAADHVHVARAVGLLAVLPAPPDVPAPARRIEPANDIERAIAAVAADERARPQLWQAVWEGDVVLPVVAYELVRPEGANFQFLTVPVPEAPLVLGFGTEERFDAMVPDLPYNRVLAPGRDLPKFWPAGHWLMLNGGYEHHVVLSPWEIAGLPHGGRSELPHPRAVHIEGTGGDERAELLAGLLAELQADLAGDPRVGIAQVHWARVRGRAQVAAGRGGRWQDVLVVRTVVATPEAETAAVQAVSTALPARVFPSALVIGRQEALAHPFVDAVLAEARPMLPDDRPDHRPDHAPDDGPSGEA